jgi:hypothetical protein
VKLTAHLRLVSRSKNGWSCTSTPPIRLHGVVLRRSTGTTLLHLYVSCFYRLYIREIPTVTFNVLVNTFTNVF